MARQKKVNFTLWDTGLSGGTRVVYEIANRLAKRNYDVHITSLGGTHEWFPLEVPVTYLTPPTILKIIEPYIKLRYKHPARYNNMQKFLNKMHVNVDLDFIKPLSKAIPDCDFNIATLYSTAFPVWLNGKGGLFYLMQDYYEQMETSFEKRAFQSTLRLGFSFIVDSSYLKDLVLSEQPDAKIKVGLLGVDSEVFHKAYPAQNNNEHSTIIAILRGGYTKGNDILINVLNSVNKIKPINVRLITNNTSLLSYQKTIAFHFTPYIGINDKFLASLYSSSDLFLFTSRVEGFGLPPLEAMACGVPVVTTDCKGNRDYAIDGHNCLMHEPSDLNGLISSVITLLSNDAMRTHLIDNGLTTAKELTWEKTVDKYEEAFNNFTK